MNQSTALKVLLIHFIFSPVTSALDIDVQKYGARCDNRVDDTVALQKAADAVPASGATLVFPKNGICRIHSTLFLKSNTKVLGQNSKIFANIPWKGGPQNHYAMMENKTSYDMFADHPGTGPERIDANFEIRDLIFDYGDFNSIPVPNGGKHALRFQFARNILVINNTFHGGEDSVAGVGVTNMRVEGNRAYDFSNCAYDFWYGPKNVQVVDNYAETFSSAQIVNFNPDRTVPNGSHMMAQGFLLTGNNFLVTGPQAVPIQLEPLDFNGTVMEVLVSNNTLNNSFLALRGDTRFAQISDNSITRVIGGAPAMESYPMYDSTPDSILFYNNSVHETQTSPMHLGKIRIEAKHSIIQYNSTDEKGSDVPTVYTGAFPVEKKANIADSIDPRLNWRVFNPFWYLANHPDLLQALGSDNYDSAIQHWLNTGGTHEARMGLSTFSVREYLDLYSDVAQAFGPSNYQQALLHFVSHGYKEGRVGRKYLQPNVFNVQSYLNRYADLKSAFGPDLERATDHWLNAGVNEGRIGK